MKQPRAAFGQNPVGRFDRGTEDANCATCLAADGADGVVEIALLDVPGSGGGKELAFELEEKGYEWLRPLDEENGVTVNG